MEDKKEVQQTILVEPSAKEKVTNEEFISVLRSIAPGTNIRTGIDGILKAGKGALIVMENEWLYPIADGGFRLNAKFSPQKIIELSKMDGAIVLSKDMKRIVSANVLLTPDSKISTSETGTRHKAAERTAKQTGSLVIAVSERRNEVTVYYKNMRHPMPDSDELLRKTNEQVQILEKQRDLFDRAIKQLTHFELRDYSSLEQAIYAIQKGYMIRKIALNLQRYIIELGKEGALLKTRLKELLSGVEEETDLVVKDYTQIDLKKSVAFLESYSYDDLLEREKILKALTLDEPVRKDPIKGWRILSRTSIPKQDITAVILEAGSLSKAIGSADVFYQAILGEEKGKLFKEQMDSLRLVV